MWSWPRPRQKMRSWPQVSMTARFSMRSWPGGGGRLESERVPLPGSGGSRSTMQPFQPLPLPTTSKHLPPPSTHGLPCFFSGICSYFKNAFILAILTLTYTANIILDLLLSTHYLSGPTSSSPYFHYLYFIPILVDRPTQLICTFHLFFPWQS